MKINFTYIKSLKGIILSGFFCVILCLVAFRKPLMRSYARWFSVETATKGADAIFVLAGSDNEVRFGHALNLYQQRYAPKLLFSTTKSQQSIYASYFDCRENAEITICESLGINYDFVSSNKGGATSTFDEAYDLAAYANNHAFKRLIVVTEKFHTKRALYAIEKVFDRLNLNIEVEVSGARSRHFTEYDWWKTESGLTNYFLEPIKFIMYVFNSRNLDYVEEN